MLIACGIYSPAGRETNSDCRTVILRKLNVYFEHSFIFGMIERGCNPGFEWFETRLYEIDWVSQAHNLLSRIDLGT